MTNNYQSVVLFNMQVSKYLFATKNIHDCKKEKLKLYVYKKFKRITNTKLRRQGGNLKKTVAGLA